ncbi:MAG: peptidoglycan-binding domain-containing protein, partial [Nitrospinota bacterium]
TSTVDTGYSYNDSVSVIAIDLNLFDVKSGLQIPGLTSRNSLAYTRHRKSGDVGGLILKTGISFFINYSRSEGPQQAVRTLLELSLIELLGKLTKVPYWDCLDLDILADELFKPVGKWWAKKSKEERVLTVQQLLKNLGRLNQEPNGRKDEKTVLAVREFQKASKMKSDGQISVELFLRLKSQEKKAGLGATGKVKKRALLSDMKKEEKGGFQVEKIEAGGTNVGSRASMSVGSDGSLHVAYFDPSKQALQYATKIGKEWIHKTLDGDLETKNQNEVSIHIALDKKNQPHILYAFRLGGGGIEIRYARFEASWKKEMIEMFSASQKRVPGTFIFFSKGNVNLLYSGDQLTNVKKTDGHWVANDSYEMKEFLKLDLERAFDKKGRVYFNFGKFTELVTAWHDGNEWSVRSVSLEQKVLDTALVADSKGNLHTIAVTQDGELVHLVARKYSGTILKKEVLKKGLGENGMGIRVSMAIAPDDTIHALYNVLGSQKEHKNGIHYLRLEKNGNRKSMVVEEGNFTGRSIAVGPSGEAHLIFFDNANGDLMYGSSLGR